MRRDDYTVFTEKFCPVEQSPDNFLFETYGEDYEIVKNTDPNYIWTVMDCDGKLYIVPGWHWVNRMNYFITKNPWSEGQRDYLY